MKKVSTEHDRMQAAFKQKSKATFGRAQSYAPQPNEGGPVVDPAGAPTEDTVPAVLAHGEYVLPADTVEAVGAENLDALKDATHTPVAAQKKFGKADGGVIQAIKNRRNRLDAAEQAAVNNAPEQIEEQAKSIERQTKEKVVEPANKMVDKGKGVIDRVKKAFGMADGGWVYNGNSIAGDQSNRAYRRMERAQAAPAAAEPTKPVAAPAQPTPTVFGTVTTPAYQSLWNKTAGATVAPGDLASMARPGSSFGFSPFGMRDGGLTDDEIRRRADAFRSANRVPTTMPVETAPPTYEVQEGQTARGRTFEKFGSQPAQPVDPRRAEDLAKNPPKPAAPAQPAPKPGLLSRVTAPIRALASPFAVGAAAMTHSRDVGAGSDIVEGAPRKGAFNVTPEAAALSDTEKYSLMNELNNPRTHPERQKQIRELMIGKQPTAAPETPATKFGAPSTVPAKPAAAAPAPAAPAPGKINAPALARMGIPLDQLERPAVPDNMRGEIVRNARPDPGQHINLGDYGTDGVAIFGSASKPGGKIDTFTGAGGGTNKATGYAPKGVDFGIKPGEVEQYRADLRKFGQLGPRPDAARSPQAFQAHAQAGAQYDQAHAQGQAAMVKANADYVNAVTARDEKAAQAAEKQWENSLKMLAENEKDLDRLGELVATRGIPGLEGEDPKQVAAAIQLAARTKTFDLNGRKVTLAQLDPTERAKHITRILPDVRAGFAKTGVSSSPPSMFGQNPLRVTTAKDLPNMVTSPSLIFGFDKTLEVGNGNYLRMGDMTPEEVAEVERRRLQDKR